VAFEICDEWFERLLQQFSRCFVRFDIAVLVASGAAAEIVEADGSERVLDFIGDQIGGNIREHRLRDLLDLGRELRTRGDKSTKDNLGLRRCQGLEC
jgi:hypothetical protein